MQQKEERNKKLKLLLAAVLLMICCGLGFMTWRLYQKKLRSEENAAAWNAADSGTESDEEAFGTVHDTVTYQGKTYRRNTYVKAILCMGVDRDEELAEKQQAGSGGQSDGVFVIAQDSARDTVKILAIPRDTMTKIVLTDIAGNVLAADTQHLTLAYAYGDGRELSCEYMEKAVTELLGGLKIDGYAAVSMKALGTINDAVGGVTVTIDDEGLESRDPAFRYGETITLKGNQAESYIRYRDITKSQTALTRLERQKHFIEAFSKSMRRTAAEKDGFIPDLLDQITPYMVTDLTKDQLLDMGMAFLKSSQTLGDEDILTLPGEGVVAEVYDEYIPDLEKTQEMVLDLFYRIEE